MYVWMIWLQGDDSTWLEAAWDDEMTAENRSGWEGEVARVRRMALNNEYEYRIQKVRVPDVRALFEIPTTEAQAADKETH